MLQAKACHQGLKPKASLFGLEIIDGLVLFPLFYLCAVILGHLVWGIAVAGALAVALRMLKWGRLPGYSSALVWFLILDPKSSALGRDLAPRYPTRRAGELGSQP